MTAVLAVAAVLVALAAAVKAVPVLVRAAVATGRALWRAVRWSGRSIHAAARQVHAYLKLPASVLTIANDLGTFRSLAQEASEEWRGASRFMATTVHDLELRVVRLEELAHHHEPA